MKRATPNKRLSRREREALDALYRIGNGSAVEIREAMANPPTNTAVRTHLSNLEAKGYVRFDSDGTRYIYEPVVPREEMARDVVNEALQTFFENRAELLVATLIDRKRSQVSEEELDRMLKLIEEARRNGL